MIAERRQNGDIYVRRTPRYYELLEYEIKSMNALTAKNSSLPDPLLFVPGSFLWRRPEKPGEKPLYEGRIDNRGYKT